ncbi:hypothetical protein [Roseobacter sp. SK209-2-6]|uniref:hypothetical protein n=1 Tax=Roseobacter sp. SK209-2-6 TaxID=388739 RepID=UPI0005610DF3|nr:hypothetical protein [Roseobacter sp. SK209-2-6]
MDAFFRPESLEKILGRAYKNQKGLVSKRSVALTGIGEILVDWVEQKTLLEIDSTISIFIANNEGDEKRAIKPDEMAKFTRRFSNRFASEISFIMSSFAQLVSDVEVATAIYHWPMPGFLPQLVRFGYPTPYHLALSRELSTSARIEVHKQYEAIAKYIEHDPLDDWDAARAKVENAMSVSLFPALNEDDIEALEELLNKNKEADSD